MRLLIKDRHRRGAVKGGLACKRVKRDHGERIEVSARVKRAAVDGLWRHVTRCTHRRAPSSQLFYTLSDAEVHHRHRPLGGDHQVSRLDVAMYDPSLMEGVERLTDLRADVHNMLRGKLTLATHQVGEGLPLKELHHNVVIPLILTHSVHRHHALRLDFSERARLIHKALKGLIISLLM